MGPPDATALPSTLLRSCFFTIFYIQMQCRTEVQRCLATMNCPEYFEMVEDRLQQEEERACAVLDQATSKAKLLRLVDDVFVSQQVMPLTCFFRSYIRDCLIM